MKIAKKALAVVSALAITAMSTPGITISAASPGQTFSVGNGQNQHKGTSDGYSYEIWLDNTGGSGTMTLGQGGAFKAEWSASVSRGNFLARRGKDFGSQKKASDYDYIGLDYEATYRQTGSASGNSRLCVYGWFENQGAAGNVPLVEYYIIEDWVDWCPDGNGKMVTIDGAQYKIFQNDHTGPTIHGGNETFKQYFSVRQSKRTSGHITVSDHFNAWAQQGWGIGNLYEVALNAEGWQSSGVADVTKLELSTDGPSPTTSGTTQTTSGTQQTGWTQATSSSGGGSSSSGQTFTVGNGRNQYKGVSDGYSYEIWLDNTGGSGSMTLGSGGTFKTEWSASVSRGNFLARRGKDFGSKKKATDYKSITMDYEATYRQTGSASGNSRLCVYGWFENQGAAGNPPLVEYYIIEDWVDWCPDANGTMVTIDGAQYKIFQMDHTGPTIHGGNETFKQYFSVRQSKRTSGHITVSDHFNAWAQQGWGIGNLYEVALNAEGWQSSGVADVTKLIVEYDDGTGTTATTSATTTSNTSGTTGTTGSTQTTAKIEGIAAHQNNDYTYDPNGTGFKDYMGKCFRLGTCVNRNNIQNSQVQQFIKQNFNSITCENEMKPDTICDRGNSSGDNIAINLNSAAPILKFCEQNGIGLRGHTFVWYSQTPGWIFNENFQDYGQKVSKDRMNARLESMIKNTFDAIKSQYPNLKLYSYDVCNELFQNDGGGFRGDGKESSDWWSVYHSDEFVINAFKYARKYAPADCKLYMNDYNEYFALKSEDLYNMAKKIMQAGDYIDGIGMQSHMHYCDFGMTGSATESKDPQFDTYAGTIDKFSSLGLDVQITELDVTTCSKPEGASLFVDIFKVACERADRISSVTLWGHCDSASWRQSYQEWDEKYTGGQRTQGGNPLPFDANCQPKSFYNDIIAQPSLVTTTTSSSTTTSTTTASTTASTSKSTTTSSSTTTSTTTTTQKKGMKGDIDCNGKLELGDAVMLAKASSGIDVGLSTMGKTNGDLNANGSLDSDDLKTMLRYFAGIISKL